MEELDKSIQSYFKLAEASTYFLDQAFSSLDLALKSTAKSILFAQRLDLIDPTDLDREILKDLKLNQTAIEMLRSEPVDPLSQKTLEDLQSAWNIPDELLFTNGVKISKDHLVTSTDIIGHITNFAFFIETLTNRHLLFLKQDKRLDTFSYSQLSQARILNRILYIFKNEVQSNSITLNELTYLFTLRNKTVHYTPENAISLNVSISALTRIWNQTIKLVERFHQEEQFSEPKFATEIEVRKKWLLERWTS